LQAQDAIPDARPSLIDVVWPGAAMGVGGFPVGGLLGIAIADCSGSDDGFCALEGGFFGAAALGTIGLATGVHLGNDRRGSYALDLATAGGIWGVTIGLLAASDWPDTATTVAFFTLPIAQLVATVVVERAVGDWRARRSHAPELSLGPTAGDGGMLVARWKF
jgi:hypothetical protein